MKRRWGIPALIGLLLMPTVAHAAMACTVDLFTPGYGTCEATAGTTHIFSNFVCQYQKTISDILNQVFCGVSDALTQPLYIILTLFVTFLGAGILIGTTQFTAREMIHALAKIALVVGFATQADLLIGILYKGLIGFLNGSVELVLKSVANSAVNGAANNGVSFSDANGLLNNLDTIINNFLKSGSLESAKPEDGANQCKDSPLPLMMTFLVSAPPLFGLGVTMLFKLVSVLVRAVIGYLFSLTLIMFLITLAPMFLSFSLFHATRSFFEKWVQYLMSCSLQIVVVFAFIGFVMSMGLESDFKKLMNLSVPFNKTAWQEGARQPYNNWCSLPEHIDAKTGQGSGDAVSPGGMWKIPDILRFIGTEMFKLLLLAMLVEKTLELAPEVARKLSGLDTAPSLGGKGAGGYNIQMQGANVLHSMKGGIVSGFGRGGDMLTRLQNSASEGFTGLMRGTDASRGGALSEFARSLIGLR